MNMVELVEAYLARQRSLGMRFDSAERLLHRFCRALGNPTASLNLHDGLLTHLSAARTPRQSVRQSPREADAQGRD
jgi:hypothetical protein